MYRRPPALCRATLLLAVLLATGPALLLAQDSARFKWWQNETVQKQLGLAGDQVKRIEAVFQGALPDLRRGKQQLDALEGELSRLVEKSADDAAVVQQVDRVEAARGVLNKTRVLMLLRMRRLLSPDQRVRLDAFHMGRGSDHADHPKRGAEHSDREKRH